MAGTIRRIAVNTGGGDAPGLNAVIRAVVLAALRRGWEVVGIRKGYQGLLDMKDGLVALNADMVSGITHLGGTILGANNRGNPFQLPDGAGNVQDASRYLVERFHDEGFDALVAIGGDGSLAIARDLHERYKLPVIGVPKTIDNDLDCTEYTFGFDTAVATATEALEKLHSTAKSHDRVMVVELMGRYAGWIALHAGIAGDAHVILLPEIPFDLEAVCRTILERDRVGQQYSLVVVAEGAQPQGGTPIFKDPGGGGRQARLGGIAQRVAHAIAQATGKETRELVLGHLQRGGPPTAFDRLLSVRLGAAAVRLIEMGEFGCMVALQSDRIHSVPLAEATRRLRRIPLDSDTLQTARDLGICLGEG
ncbi:MAG TPA: ATP-dependent 6-phosphofructokinase [Candidatus Competibacteraceae bacterium]|nr:ATP-dependent 6-phosphofructokinase [Candidatus Competibacteraceae bacterium]